MRNPLYFFVFFFLLSAVVVQAQKFGYINSELIFNKMPDYAKAKTELEKFTVAWQKEIEEMQQHIRRMQDTYVAEKVLLTAEMKKEREDEIAKKEEELEAHQNKIFGFSGLYFLKKQELMKPMQDKVADAVEKVAKSNRLAIIFDKAGELIMIYTDPRHDYTDFVLEDLGLGDPVDKIK